MDPETIKAWAPVAAAFAGGLVGGFSAYLVALANIGGQRQTARDQALREWRAAAIKQLYEAENASYALLVHSGKYLADPPGQQLLLTVGGQLSESIVAAQSR